MRRIPRLRRPSGLASNSIIGAPSASGPSRCLAPFTHQRPTPTPTRPVCPRIIPARFYSDKPQVAPVQETQGTEIQDALVPQDTDAVVTETSETGLAGPYVPPPPRLDAAREHEVADPTYVPATTAKGLETVGGVAKWWDNPEHWGKTGDFVGFRAPKKVQDPVLIEAAVRRAVIEAFALRSVGREDELVSVWPSYLAKERLLRLLGAEVRVSSGGLVFGDGVAEVVAEGLRWGVEDGGSPFTLKVKDVASLRGGWDESWKSVSLADPRIRFAITKRIFQLTSILIPDHRLAAITTVQTLLNVVQKPPKPATLTKELQHHATLQDLPNVTIAKKRLTRGDKEIAIGRYPLMQAEFAKRGLPARGHGGARKGREIARLRGGV